MASATNSDKAKRKPVKKQSRLKDPILSKSLVPGLVRVVGAPTLAGDYRMKQKEGLLSSEPTRPIVHTIDSVDETHLYGVPTGWFGRAEFSYEKSSIEWHEKLPS